MNTNVAGPDLETGAGGVNSAQAHLLKNTCATFGSVFKKRVWEDPYNEEEHCDESDGAGESDASVHQYTYAGAPRPNEVSDSSSDDGTFTTPLTDYQGPRRRGTGRKHKHANKKAKQGLAKANPEKRERSIRLGLLVSNHALKASWHDITHPTSRRRGGGCSVSSTHGKEHGTCAYNILRSANDNMDRVLQDMGDDRMRQHGNSNAQGIALTADLERSATIRVRAFTKEEEATLLASEASIPHLENLASDKKSRAYVAQVKAKVASMKRHQNMRYYEFSHFRIRNDDVCQSCYRNWYGFGKSSTGPNSWLKKVWQRRVRAVRIAMFDRGGRMEQGSGVRVLDEDPDEKYEFDDSKPESLRTSIAVAWIRLLAMRIGEMMPMVTKNSEVSDGDVEFRLPPGTKGAIHNEYVADMQACKGGDDPLSYTAFLRVWDKHTLLQNIVISRTKGEFVRCDSCISYSNLLQTERDATKRAQLRHARRIHMYKMWMERKFYYERREEARQNPDVLLSIIIDGMDQRKSEIPRVPRGQVTHSLDALYRVKQTITGALVHHVGRFFFISTCDIKGGATLEIECLHRTIARTLEYKLANGLPRPRDLCIQMDNCGHQKNKYMMAYLTHLVDNGQFANITLSFLEKGHTHEDIDQTFSVLSKAFKQSTCHTPSEFRRQVHEAFPDTPSLDEPAHLGTAIFTHVEQIEYTHDVVNWMAEALDKKLKYIQKPHVFTFQRNSEGDATMHYKAWWRRRDWKPAAVVYSRSAVSDMDADPSSEDEETDGVVLPATRKAQRIAQTKETRGARVGAAAAAKKRAAPQPLVVIDDVAQFAIETRAEDELGGIHEAVQVLQRDSSAGRPSPPGAYLSSKLDQEMVLNKFLIGMMGPIASSMGIRVLMKPLEDEPARHPGRRYFLLAGENPPPKNNFEYDQIASAEGQEAANAWNKEERIGLNSHGDKPHNLWEDIKKSWLLNLHPAWNDEHFAEWREWKDQRLSFAETRDDPGARKFAVGTGEGRFAGEIGNTDACGRQRMDWRDLSRPGTLEEFTCDVGSEEDEPEHLVGATDTVSGAAVTHMAAAAAENVLWREAIQGRDTSVVEPLAAGHMVLLRMSHDGPTIRLPPGWDEGFSSVPVWVAMVKHSWAAENNTAEVTVGFWGQSHANINEPWTPLQNNRKQLWTAGVDRASVLFSWQKGAGGSAQIPRKTRESLGKYFKGPYKRSSPTSLWSTLGPVDQWIGWKEWDAQVARVQQAGP